MNPDNLFDIPAEQPDRLTQARNALANAEREQSDAEWNTEAGTDLRPLRDAVERARHELRLAELERLAR